MLDSTKLKNLNLFSPLKVQLKFYNSNGTVIILIKGYSIRDDGILAYLFQRVKSTPL